MKTITIHGIKCTAGVKISKVSRNNNSLAKLREKFPHLETAHDALMPIKLEVTDADKVGAIPKEFMACAFARAACRALKADGAFMGIKGSILVVKNAAIRFDTPGSVSREMAILDRTQDAKHFAPGTYRLSAVTRARRLGVGWKKKREDRKRRPKKQNGFMIETAGLKNHFTLGARNEKDLALD